MKMNIMLRTYMLPGPKGLFCSSDAVLAGAGCCVCPRRLFPRKTGTAAFSFTNDVMRGSDFSVSKEIKFISGVSPRFYE